MAQHTQDTYRAGVVGDAETAGVTDHSVHGVAASTLVLGRLPDQAHSRLIDEHSPQILRRRRWFCTNMRMQLALGKQRRL
jgi:hypothetical protein